MSKAQADALLFKQQLPLQAARKIREEKAEQSDEKRTDRCCGKQIPNVARIPTRRADDLIIDKVTRDESDQQLYAKNQRGLYPSIHQCKFIL